MNVGDTVRAAACAAMALASGCHSSPSREAAQAGPSCCDVAKHAELVIARAPERTRDDATRFYAEVIDLCQAPGLAQRARACLTRAADLAAARSCPSLPATADTSNSETETAGGTPTCGTVVARAMRILGREPDAPVSPTDRAEEEQLFMRDCAATIPEGRRCAAKALTVDGIEECLALRADEDDAEDDPPDDLPDPSLP